MNSASANCPACRNVVRFLKIGEVATCPVCGFKYQMSSGARREAPPPLPFMSFLKTMIIVCAMVAALGTIVLAVIFVGCMRLLKNV